MNAADRLNQRILALKSPVVVGLDPVLSAIPDEYKEPYRNLPNAFEAVAKTLVDFNRDLIDAVAGVVPAVKPQMAFYEKYGWQGCQALEKTVKYARKKGLIVVGDGKRNDIGNTAQAYAQGCLGRVDLLDGGMAPSLDLDWLTVSPFLGTDSLTPFVEVAITNNKGIFILVKTSNPSSGELQNIKMENGKTVAENLAVFVNEQGQQAVGESGYSPIGAVVGATFPAEAETLREIMPKSIFLVPGYGAQGGGADDVAPCFNDDGLGAIINSSRGIMCAYQEKWTAQQCSRADFKLAAREASEKMRDEIVVALKKKRKGGW